jgi:hypothetical protein
MTGNLFFFWYNIKLMKNNQKHQIRLKLPGISFEIRTSATQIVKLTIILCVFIIAMTLIVKTAFFVPERNIKKHLLII